MLQLCLSRARDLRFHARQIHPVCTRFTAIVLVPRAGLEPARLSAGDFESPASTNFATWAVFIHGLVCVVGFEPTVSRVRGEWINQVFPHTERLVGVQGFEPWTLCSQSRCATGLRYTPKYDGARGGTRTHRTLILNQVRLPITSHAQNWP